MSQIKLSGNASGAGVFTIASPATATDRTLNLPDSAGTLTTTEAVLTQFNASGSAPVYACRAWVNFDGTTNTGGYCTIRASGNVSSITDNGTGDYTVNFTTAMPDANYSWALGFADTTPDHSLFGGYTLTSPTTSALRVGKFLNDIITANRDPQYVCISVFR
jgi:hypothetical protein